MGACGKGSGGALLRDPVGMSQGIEAMGKKPRSAKSFFRIAERAERSFIRKRISNCNSMPVTPILT